MKPLSTFKQISRRMMDSWISSPDGPGDPEQIYGPVRGLLRPNMILAVIDTRAMDHRDFHIDCVHGYRLPTGLADMGTMQRSRSFSDFPDQKYLREIVIPAYVDAAERQRPTMTRVAARLLDMNVAYDRLILPQKNSAGRSEWCIGLLDMQLLLPAASKDERSDDVDLGILQLLAEGASAREIAALLSRSHRTIEHRIERLKLRVQARSTAHLVALAISAGVGGLTMQDA